MELAGGEVDDAPELGVLDVAGDDVSVLAGVDVSEVAGVDVSELAGVDVSVLAGVDVSELSADDVSELSEGEVDESSGLGEGVGDDVDVSEVGKEEEAGGTVSAGSAV